MLRNLIGQESMFGFCIFLIVTCCLTLPKSVQGYAEDKSNPFEPINELYVNPTLAENIGNTIALINDGVYEATEKVINRMNNMMDQPSLYWLDKKSKIWLPSNANSADTQSTISYTEEVLDMLRNFYPDIDVSQVDKLKDDIESYPPTYYAEGILDDILSSENNYKVVSFAIYNLPNRDCKALASNGEICCNDRPECQSIGSFYCNVTCQNTATSCENGIEEYKSLYIDQVVKLISQSKYENIKKVFLIEPDSLPNCVTNIGKNGCTKLTCEGYKEGIIYAINKLSTIANSYLYLDLSHGGWLGWEENMNLMMDILEDFPLQKLRGFSTNTANYNQLGIPCQYNLPTNSIINDVMGETAEIREYSDMIAYCLNAPEDKCCEDPCNLIQQFNVGNNEHNYIQGLNLIIQNRGYKFDTFDKNPRFITDTSRNGNPNARKGTKACAVWCNVDNAAIGHFPSGNTLLPNVIDAYAWLKTPGESDGCIDAATQGNCEAKSEQICVRYDEDCGTHPQNIGSRKNQECPPEAGKWFDFQIIQLQNY